MADLARLARVTPATASRTLNGYRVGFSVRPEVRARIEAAAKSLGYQANLVARTLRARRTGIVALLGLHLETMKEGGVAGELAHAFTWHATRAGLTVCTTFLDPSASAYELPSWRVDGAVLIAPSAAAHLAPVAASGLPYVALNGECGAGGVALRVDEQSGMRAAVAHLRGLGHRRIAYANAGRWADLDHSSVSERHTAFRSLCPAQGSQPPARAARKRCVAEPFWDEAIGKKGATAIITYDHLVAADLVHEARRRGVAVPGQVSILTFNDDRICSLLTPRLTAISIPVKSMGEIAAQVLVRMCGGQTADPPPPLACGLVIRESTAPPPA